MIIKHFELKKISLKEYSYFLFYGENEGLKAELIKNNFEINFKEKIYKYDEKEILNNKENFFNKILYVLASIFSLSVNPLNGIIILAQFLYYILVQKKIKIFFLLNIFVFIVYVSLNFNYLLDQFNYTTHYATFSKSFFIGYFFNVYF